MRKDYTSVTLPKEIMNLVDQTIEGKGYSSRSEYIKALIRKDIKETF